MAFHSVHDALATDSLPAAAWSLLEPQLPRQGIFYLEDNCKRLRKAILRLCEKSLISTDDFSQIIKNKKTAKIFFEDMSFWFGEKSYIKTTKKHEE
ncbi:hypothetical protein [Chromobacterium sp. Beijing]|uniref:hypothetical protein n=1 Tax=Chromobacterium sp. Beijing TaxID=2735795 RepID=UPI001F198084|nr:hypothetical protein [Chromobacterium sp. Beijing]UJB33416.1 hypothetical protein HQN78_21510 [Chromobacterium sp. Beijing]